MNMKDRIMSITEENNGIVTSKLIDELGLSRKALSELVKEEKLFRAERGVYVMESGYLHDYYYLQYRFPKGVFSHETALYLLGYSDRIPHNPQMTFPQGYNTSRAIEAGISPFVTSKNLDSGIINITVSGGTTLRLYDVEKTLVDLLNSRYSEDKEQFIPAIKQYVKSKDRNFGKLMGYAKQQKVETIVQQYIEVLL